MVRRRAARRPDLRQMGKTDAARATLDQARKRFPRSEELVALDAATRLRAKQPKEADQVLAEFLEQNPENIAIALLRAQVLADVLGNVPEARKLLVNLAERSENSAPLVQLALLDLRQKDHDAVAATIAKIRSRWKEAAAGDLLEAQLALDQGNPAAASAAFDAALKKDPNNKMVLFWKAQLDSRIGSAPEAARTLEEIVKERPTKELDTGLSLTAAAESALANLALASGDLDSAIDRFEDLKNGGAGALGRADRWQLVAAYVAKGQWDTAKQEMNALLNDLKSPPTNDERVGAADIYRRRGDLAAAQAQLDLVLKVNPVHPAAVVTQASMLADAKKLDAAAALLRKTIADSGEKPHAVFFLLLAAVENRMPPADTAGAARWPPSTRGSPCSPTRSSWSRPGTSSSARPVTPRRRRRLSQPRPRTRQRRLAPPALRGLGRAKGLRRCRAGAPRTAQEEPQGFGAGGQPGPAGPAPGRPRRLRATMTPSAGPRRTRPPR